MSMPDPSAPNPSGGPRMSRTVKLVLMGVAGAALLYSCAPAIGGGSGFFWLLPWLFRGGSTVSAPATPGQTATPTARESPGQTAPAQSQRGGFGSTGSSGSSGGSS